MPRLPRPGVPDRRPTGASRDVHPVVLTDHLDDRAALAHRHATDNDTAAVHGAADHHATDHDTADDERTADHADHADDAHNHTHTHGTRDHAVSLTGDGRQPGPCGGLPPGQTWRCGTMRR